MTERQKRFVEFYLQTGSPAKAARAAGYSQKNAANIGAENMKKPPIKAAIEKRLRHLDRIRIATTEETLEHFTKMLRGEVFEEVATNSGKILKLATPVRDRIKAGELLLKVHGAFTNKVEVQTSNADLLMKLLKEIEDEEINEAAAE